MPRIRVAAIENRRDVVATVDPRRNEEANLIDQASIEECPVYVATALKQQSTNAKMFPEQKDRLHKVHRAFSRNNIGDAGVSERSEVFRWSLPAHNGDEVITVDISARPLQLTRRINRNRVGIGALGHVHGLCLLKRY